MSDPFSKFRSKIKESAAVPVQHQEEDEDDSFIESDILPGVEPPTEFPQNDEFEFVFFPKNDITAYDLARILSLTQMMITNEIYGKVPDELKKHFTRFKEIIQPQSN